MKFKGTKGNWFTLNQNDEKLWFNISSHKSVIARTFYGPAEPIVTEQEAQYNALLISKAPEMLEMLIKYNSIIKTKELENLIKEATEI
jgi:hypothetical protein